MLSFDFFEKDLGLVFAQVLALAFEMLGNMCITIIICCPVSEAINFQIKIRFRQAVFRHDQKRQQKRLNVFRKKKVF